MTVQLYNAEQVELLRSVFADKGRNNTFAYNIVVPWYDFPIEDDTDGDPFNDNDSSYPDGWTQVDDALITTTNETYGFWYLVGSGANNTWKYRRQLTYNVEADATDGDFISFMWHPIVYRPTGNPNDESYYFGIYANNAGAINENIFIRVVLNWNSAGGVWRARTERKDGTTQTDGSWFTLSSHPQISPLFVRQTIRYFAANTNEVARGYIGASRIESSQTPLMNDIMNVTWGQIWLQCHMSRGAGGIQNYLYIGGVDRNLRQ